jgi:hypothetical protein
MNAWSNTAAKQLLEHWKRCGLTRLPAATDAGTKQAWVNPAPAYGGSFEAVPFIQK